MVFHHLVVALAGRTKQLQELSCPCCRSSFHLSYDFLAHNLLHPAANHLHPPHPLHLLIFLHLLIHAFHLRHRPNKHRHPLFALLLHGFQQRRQFIRLNQPNILVRMLLLQIALIQGCPLAIGRPVRQHTGRKVVVAHEGVVNAVLHDFVRQFVRHRRFMLIVALPLNRVHSTGG